MRGTGLVGDIETVIGEHNIGINGEERERGGFPRSVSILDKIIVDKSGSVKSAMDTVAAS
jgi:hypothetical protein